VKSDFECEGSKSKGIQPRFIIKDFNIKLSDNSVNKQRQFRSGLGSSHLFEKA